MNTQRIIILDDHTLFLKGIALYLKTYNEKYDLYIYQSISKLKSDNLDFNDFDLLISDIDMPGEDTFGLFDYLKRHYPNLPILVVSMHKKTVIIEKCKELGIEGYLLKNEDEQLKKAVETILKGEKYYSRTVLDFYEQIKNRQNVLSNREKQIIKLIAQAYNNQEIAEQLNVTVETIKTHKKNIKAKLKISTPHEMMEYVKTHFLV